MKAYVDTSVLLRVVLGEPNSLREWRTIDFALCSEITRVEALRTIDRARIRLGLADAEVARQRGDVLDVLDAFHIARLDQAVLDRAAEPFPTTLRTLDAMHLATALLARIEHQDLVLATHDAEMALGARALGFRVVGSG
jgi:predicted nucleic acid-binding protein